MRGSDRVDSDHARFGVTLINRRLALHKHPSALPKTRLRVHSIAFVERQDDKGNVVLMPDPAACANVAATIRDRSPV